MPASRRANPPGHTPIAFVQAIVLAYKQRGLNPADALREAQITPSQATSASGRITAPQFERLCAAAMRELDDEAPGWFERRLPWGSYGMLARASSSAPTLGLAMQRWCRHHGLLTRDVTLHLQHTDGAASVTIHEHRDLGPLREFALLSLLRNLHGLSCWWIAERIDLHEVQFPFATPPHADVYARLFPGPVQFGAAHARLMFDARHLQWPLRRDTAAHDAMLRHALPIMVWPYRQDDLLAPQVRRLLARPNLLHTAQTLAEQLSLSPRTLQRRLHAEGSSLQALKDDTRRARAAELLLRSNLPIARVARAAGFQNDKSFIRAFRAWTGQTPEEFRQRGGPGTGSIDVDKSAENAIT